MYLFIQLAVTRDPLVEKSMHRPRLHASQEFKLILVHNTSSIEYATRWLYCVEYSIWLEELVYLCSGCLLRAFIAA